MSNIFLKPHALFVAIIELKYQRAKASSEQDGAGMAIFNVKVNEIRQQNGMQQISDDEIYKSVSFHVHHNPEDHSEDSR